MKRKLILRAPLAAAIVLAAAAVSCMGATELMDGLETSVKMANHKYLVVTSLTPTPAEQNAVPNADPVIQFDRDIAQESLGGNIQIEVEGGTVFTSWVNNYDKATRTLTIQLTEPFEGQKTYTIRLLSGLRGADGSRLQKPESWSFKTTQMTTGTFWFGEKNDQTNPLQYANIALQSRTVPGISGQLGTRVPVYLTVKKKTPGSIWDYHLTDDENAAKNPASIPGGEWIRGNQTEFLTAWDFPDEGPNTLHLLIWEQGADKPMTVSRTIIVDRAPPPPPVSVGSKNGKYRDLSVENLVTLTWKPGAGDGISIFRFAVDSEPEGEGLSATSFQTFLTDGAHTFNVQERDQAGNWSQTAAYSIRVTPAIPYNGEANVPYRFSSKNPLIWREGHYAIDYTVLFSVNQVEWTPVYSGPENGFFGPLILSKSTRYYWKIQWTMKGGGVEESDIFSFSTGSI